jgi:ATP-dependent protease ClpP protease subunit
VPQGQIKIVGVIGGEPGKDDPCVSLLDVVTAVRTLPKSSTPGSAEILSVAICSPGGLTDVGDQIYDYLDSLKSAGQIVNTTTLPDPSTGKGLIGSIATKIFLVGQEREIGSSDEFFIHNPWVDPGPSDSNRLGAAQESTKKTETALRKFYSEKTNNPEEALAPLMDQETSLTATQAVAMGFATKIKPSSVPVMAIVKSKSQTDPTMKDEEILALLKKNPKALELIKNIKPEKPAPVAKKKEALDSILKGIRNLLHPRIKNVKELEADVKALNVTDQAGNGYYIDAASADPNDVVGSDIVTVDAQGNVTDTPPPAGVITLSDGSTCTVDENGTVTAYVPGTGAPMAAQIKALQDNQLEIAKALNAINDKLTTKPKGKKGKEDEEEESEDVEIGAVVKALEKEIMALKKNSKTFHVPGAGKGNHTRSEKRLSPIQLANRGMLAELRKAEA